MGDELTESQIKDAIRRTQAAQGDPAAMMVALGPIVDACPRQRVAAYVLASLVSEGMLPSEQGLELAERVLRAHPDDLELMSMLGTGFEGLHDHNALNAAPPQGALLVEIAQRLRDWPGGLGLDEERMRMEALAIAARVLGRRWDEIAERAALRLIEIAPEDSGCHYGLGLFYKTRGRFAEGQAANQRALELADWTGEALLWNLGICATGAGDCETALRAWHKLEIPIERGRFGLPEASYGPVKVRLAQYPLATRNPQRGDPDEPGQEESIWIERLSPCHGIVRSALYADELGVDYGDVILFDGAPITHHLWRDQQVPVFPHLATLSRGGYLICRFTGTQAREGQLQELSKHLPEDSIVYAHSEQVSILCASCWAKPDADRCRHAPVEHKRVIGKICAPPSLPPRELLALLDRLVADSAGQLHLIAPDLAAAAGQHERAAFERRRLAAIDAG